MRKIIVKCGIPGTYIDVGCKNYYLEVLGITAVAVRT